MRKHLLYTSFFTTLNLYTLVLPLTYVNPNFVFTGKPPLGTARRRRSPRCSSIPLSSCSAGAPAGPKPQPLGWAAERGTAVCGAGESADVGTWFVLFRLGGG